MNSKKLFLFACMLILALSCKDNSYSPGGESDGNNGGSSGGAGGGSGGGQEIGGGYILPQGSLSQEEQKKIYDPSINTTTLFKRVAGAKEHYRIPAIIVTSNNVIITANDIRQNSTKDLGQSGQGPIDVVVRRSEDLGKSWGPNIKVGQGATTKENSYGDAFLVNCHNGDVILGVVTYGGFVGQPAGKTVLYRSSDDGKTWVSNTALEVPTGAKAAFAASGQAVTLRYGQNAGQKNLLFTYIARRTDNNQLANIIAFSKDDGRNWTFSQPSTGDNLLDETKSIELSDGRVMLNHRRSVNAGGRQWSLAEYPYTSWTKQGIDPEIDDPGNNADLARYEFNGYPIKDKNYILFINANIKKNGTWFQNRKNHCVSLTKNEFRNGNGTQTGKYAYRKQLVNGGESLYSGYPAITVLPDGTIATLTEETTQNLQDQYDIVFRRFNLYWLSGGAEYVDYDKDPLFQTKNN